VHRFQVGKLRTKACVLTNVVLFLSLLFGQQGVWLVESSAIMPQCSLFGITSSRWSNSGKG